MYEKVRTFGPEHSDEDAAVMLAQLPICPTAHIQKYVYDLDSVCTEFIPAVSINTMASQKYDTVLSLFSVCNVHHLLLPNGFRLRCIHKKVELPF